MGVEQECSIYLEAISIIDISTLFENIDIDIDMTILEYIDIDKAVLENIDIDKDIFENIDIDKDILENIDIDIDIDKGILENI